MFQEAYTTAVALNNLGVSLLERHLFQQAMDAFADAVSIMKEISAASRSQEAGVSRHRPLKSTASFEAKLQKARSNLFKCQPFDAKVASHTNLCVVTEEGCGAVILPALQDGSILTSTVTFLVRIELEGKSIQECECKEPHVESAIVLSNFASVYAYVAKHASLVPAQAKQNLESAFQLFELSYSVLQNEASESELTATQVLPISILVLRSLVVLASVLQREDEEDVYYADIVNAGQFFLELAMANTMHDLAAAAA